MSRQNNNARPRLRFGRYDYAAFLTFIAYAASSLAVPLVLVDMAEELNFPLLKGGMAIGGIMQVIRSAAMCLSMVFAGIIAAKFGNRRSLGASVATMGIGILLCAFAPTYLMVMPLLLIAGIGEGVVEGLCTPFVQDMHDVEPGRYLNFTHGFWSLGTFAFALIAGVMLVTNISWRWVLASVGVVAMIPVLILLLPSKTKYVEKPKPSSSGAVMKRTGEILRTRRFWLYFVAIFFAGGGEYCLTFWSASFVRLNFAASALVGAFGTAAFSVGMFAGRTFFGNYIRQRHLKQLIIAVGIFGTVVSMLVTPFAEHFDVLPHSLVLPVLFVLLVLCGIGSAPFWPSIQSLAVDRMPHLDSTMVFILLSCAGVPGCGVFTWLMGVAGDHVGLAKSFYLVPLSYLAMTVLIILSDKGFWKQGSGFRNQVSG